MFKRDRENPNRFYICLFGKRYIFERGRNGKFKRAGFYHPKLNEVV